MLPSLMLVVLVAHGCKETLGESLWHTVLNEVVLRAAFEGHMATLLDQIRLRQKRHRIGGERINVAKFYSCTMHVMAQNR